MKDDLIERFNRNFMTSSYSKIQYNHELSEWFKNKCKEDEWRLFACTVVFNATDLPLNQERFEFEYRNRFLSKFRRRLEPNRCNQPHAIPIDDFYYYERNHKKLIKSSCRRSPHHIHSLIPIRSYQVRRIWSTDENRLDSRLARDLYSIDVVQDILFEPIVNFDSYNWLMYIQKKKDKL